MKNQSIFEIIFYQKYIQLNLKKQTVNHPTVIKML